MKAIFLVSIILVAIETTPLSADSASDAATAAQTAAETAARNAAAARAAAAAAARKARLMDLREKTQRRDAQILMDEFDRKSKRTAVPTPAIPEAPLVPPIIPKPAR